jgi:ribonucleoside-diphosphate reductase beta chain
VEHANFFETRATEYSKGATKGDWQTVWSNFDQRRKAKSANDGDSLIADDGEDMFKAAGIAAE